MAATVKLEIDLSGWYAKSARLKAVLERLPGIEVGPRDAANKDKAKASFDRNDVTYPLSSEGKAEAGSIIARGLKDVVEARASMQTPMLAAGKAIVEDVRAGIQAGRVEGPARSPGWIATKGQNTNMVGLTGDFVRSLDVRLVPAGRAQSARRRAA